MKYAIIQSGGKQYYVREGEEILLDKLNDDKNNTYDSAQVLLVRDENEIIIGQPEVKNYKVRGRLLGTVKGKKLRVSKFKAKVRYDKTIGFRPIYSKVRVERIEKEHGKAREKRIDSREKKK